MSLETLAESRPECFKCCLNYPDFTIYKSTSEAFKTYTNAKPHQVSVTTFSRTFGDPVSLKTATPILPTPREPAAGCAPLHKHLPLPHAVANPLHGWIGWGNTHVALLIINSKEFVAPSAAQPPPPPEYFSYNEMSLLLLRKYSYFLSTAQIKTSPMGAAILTYFHLFYTNRLLYLNLSRILGQ